jgi:tRNA-2-methylthio-N6-dimethylallyladenosine synthase
MSKCVYRSLPSTKDARNRVDAVKHFVDDSEVGPYLFDFAHGKKFYIKTFGCQANIRDGEIMAGYLLKAGFIETQDPREANLAIINTCAVRENAEEKVYGEIGTFKTNYAKNHSFILAVCGCMMQEEDVASSLMKTYPYVSLVFGTHNVSHLLEMLEEVVKKHERLVDVKSFPGEVVEGLPSSRFSSFEAFVNISYGCDKFCTYCIVPYTRGRERSRNMDDILKECEDLIAKGYKQITLLGQNVNSYGLDLKDGSNFATLLAKVAELGVPRLKFLTSYPSQFSDEMIETMAKYPNIVKWLHLPVQSGSTSCLTRMGRRYNREEYLELVERIRKKMPDIALTTDIIVGFPNESEEEFADTLSLADKVQYSSAFTFIYSPRRGTPAAKIVDNVSDETKHERFNRLKETIEESTSKHSLGMVNKVYEVLVEGPSKKDDNVLSGYADNGKLINFVGPSYLTGCLVNVLVKESHTYSLLGELQGDPLIYKAKDLSYLISVDPLMKEYLKIEKSLQNDPHIKELGDKLVASKKALCLAVGNDSAYQKAKEDYESILNEINTNPLLNNIKTLTPLVEENLLEVRDQLK